MKNDKRNPNPNPRLTSHHGRLPSVPGRLQHLLGLVVGRQHAHVERHRPHHRGAGAPEEPAGPFLADDARQRVADALVVAALRGGQRRVRLHPDQRQVGGGAHQGSQAPGGEPRTGLLVQGQRLAVGHALLEGLGQRVKDPEAGRGVRGLAQEPRGKAAVEARDARFLDALRRDGELRGERSSLSCFSGYFEKKEVGFSFFSRPREREWSEGGKKEVKKNLPAPRSRRAAA